MEPPPPLVDRGVDGDGMPWPGDAPGGGIGQCLCSDRDVSKAALEGDNRLFSSRREAAAGS